MYDDLILDGEVNLHKYYGYVATNVSGEFTVVNNLIYESLEKFSLKIAQYMYVHEPALCIKCLSSNTNLMETLDLQVSFIPNSSIDLSDKGPIESKAILYVKFLYPINKYKEKLESIESNGVRAKFMKDFNPY